MGAKIRVQVSGEAGYLDNYSQAMRELGAEPVAAYAPAPDLTCAGLLLCGGGDLDPALFHEADQGSDPPDVLRDRAELELFRAFHGVNKPIFGICRGMQVINVALGGALIQDLPPEQRLFHSSRAGESDRVHPIRSAEGSLFRALYGEVFLVNSSHHQAVGRLGDGLIPVAWSESGFPEAIVHSQALILGVQFHPERMAFGHRRTDTADGAPLLQHFVSLCGV